MLEKIYEDLAFIAMYDDSVLNRLRRTAEADRAESKEGGITPCSIAVEFLSENSIQIPKDSGYPTTEVQFEAGKMP